MRQIILAVALGLFALAAYKDLRTRRIPNMLVLAIAALGLERLTLAGDAGAAFASAAAAALVFCIGFLMFWRGLLGGGDVKLMAATTLLIGHQGLTSFLLAMSLSGLMVTLGTLTAARFKLDTKEAAPSAPVPVRITVPYGVAIAVAGLLTLFLQSSILV